MFLLYANYHRRSRELETPPEFAGLIIGLMAGGIITTISNIADHRATPPETASGIFIPLYNRADSGSFSCSLS